MLSLHVTYRALFMSLSGGDYDDRHFNLSVADA